MLRSKFAQTNLLRSSCSLFSAKIGRKVYKFNIDTQFRALSLLSPSHYFQSVDSKERYSHVQKCHFSSKGPTCPYELLKVSKTATAKEIKLAYFREAKKVHPDLNPNDPTAKEQFQRVSAAYELLSDESRRRAYDRTGRTNEPTYGPSGGTGGSSNRTGQQHAEDVFNSVKEDMDVVREAFSLYTQELKDELNYAVDCAKEQEWREVWAVARDHKFLIMGVVIPTVVFLRYPPAVFVVLRMLWAVSNVALVGLLRSGNISTAARMVWQGIVNLSKEQRHRSRSPRKRK